MDDKSITTRCSALMDACGDDSQGPGVKTSTQAVSRVQPRTQTALAAWAGPGRARSDHRAPRVDPFRAESQLAKPCPSHLLSLPNELLMEIVRLVSGPANAHQYASNQRSVAELTMTNQHLCALVSEVLLVQCNDAPQRLVEVAPAHRLQEIKKLCTYASKFHHRQPHLLTIPIISDLAQLAEADRFIAAKHVLKALVARTDPDSSTEYLELIRVMRPAIKRLPNAWEHSPALTPSCRFVLLTLFDASFRLVDSSCDPDEVVSTRKSIIGKLPETDVDALFNTYLSNAKQGSHALAPSLASLLTVPTVTTTLTEDKRKRHFDDLLSLAERHRIAGTIKPLVEALVKLPPAGRSSRYRRLQALTDAIVEAGEASRERLSDALGEFVVASTLLRESNGARTQAVQWSIQHVDALPPDSPEHGNALFSVLIGLAESMDWLTEDEQCIVFPLMRQRIGQLDEQRQQKVYEALADQIDDEELVDEIADEVRQWWRQSGIPWPNEH
ncbi:hypothetical protein DFQ30_011501 [Apophysomyces sp. BC1015]|nr:hypothetical protein DFQ30_011501 [Apophysomyces sp. BC1015]